MKLFGLFLCVVIASGSLIPRAALAQNPQESQKQINDLVWTAIKTELAADENDHSVFIYRDHDVTPQKNKYSIVIQTTSHGSVSRVTQLNGRPIPVAQQQAKVNTYVNSPSLQEKKRKADQHDAQQTEQLLKMLPNAFLWTIQSENNQDITLSYKPNPDFDPPTMESRVFAAMAGEMVVDRHQYRIKTFKGKLIHDVTFGWGILGRMNKGGTFDVERKELQPHVWEIVATHVHINGHILFFKTISQNEDEIDTDFRPAQPNQSLEEAAKTLMQQPNWPQSE
jgi:hypothetical protein